jgi:hypothetical protein
MKFYYFKYIYYNIYNKNRENKLTTSLLQYFGNSSFNIIIMNSLQNEFLIINKIGYY